MTTRMIYTAKSLEEPVIYPYDEILNVLECGEITQELGLMRWGSNYTFLVNATIEDKTFLAIYKPRIGERPLWDFPDGTLCQRETGSFVISEMLGWQIVPPTILREGPRGMGSVQVFIQHDPEQHFFTFGDDESVREQTRKIALFDAIINNADRKGGHCLRDEENHIWGIDHGLAFNTAPKLRTVIWDYAGEVIADERMRELTRLCDDLMDEQNPSVIRLKELIDESEFYALQDRINRLIKTSTFPMPGPGPNRPWPAI